MSYYYSRFDDLQINRLPSGLFFRVEQAEQLVQPPLMRSRDVGQSGIPHHKVNYNNFVVPQYRSTKNDDELYLPLLEVSVEVEVVATIAWTKLTQTFKNQATHPITEATYCFPLYDKSNVTAFTCTIGSDKVLKGVVKPKPQAKAEFKEAVARQQVAALLEEHTLEVFETSVGNIPAQTTVKIKICYITELKADLSGDGILVTIPTSVAPRYGAPPSSISSMGSSRSLAVPPENGLQIQIQVSSPVAISKIESRTHPVSVEIGSHGHTTTRNIRDLSAKQESSGFDPRKARATLSDRSACLGKDFVLLIQSRNGQLLASRAVIEPHPKIPNHSALMVSINLRDMYIPDVVSPKESSEIIFLADRSASMQDKIEALKTAMRFFLKSLPNNSSFNICSFGSNHAAMWPESRQYDQENVDAALTYINNHFAADMGGTEILSGLKHVVQNSSLSVNTEIIILTDGEVWNSSEIFEFIRKTRSSGPKEKTRFFCLGIGEAVSHYLVSGIGRYGGGLAEVVPVDSAGDWMQRVIGMLGAALTPSSWNIEIILDDVSTSDKLSGARICIQAPYHVPEFHAFSRGSVYFLFNEKLTTNVVKVKATAVASGESVIAELPIEKLETSRTCVHRLAAKAVLGDLKSGQSRLHDTYSKDNNTNITAGVDDLSRTEGERIGVEWRLSSKWTSFIVADDGSSVEKPSRWYRAERSDLAELTRPRFGAANYNFPMDSATLGSRVYSFPRSQQPPGRFHAYHPPPACPPYALSPDSVHGDSFSFRPHANTPQLLNKSMKKGRRKSNSYGPVHENASYQSCAPPTVLEPVTDNRTPMADPGSRPFSFQPGSQIDSESLSSPPSPIQDLTLGLLLDSSTATGAFILPRDLRTALKAKFKPSLRQSIDDWSATLLRHQREGAKDWVMDEILDTAMSVVYIENGFTSDKKLWSLMVQKARAWLNRFLDNKWDKKSLFAILKEELRDEPKDINVKTDGDGIREGNSSMANVDGKVDGKARDFLPSTKAPSERSTKSPNKNPIIEQIDRDPLDALKQVEEKGFKDPE